MKQLSRIKFANLPFLITEFFCFFPFLFPVSFLPTDTQPYALLLAGIICVIKVFSSEKWSVHREVYVLALLCVLIVFVAIFSLLNAGFMGTFRACATYFTLFLIPKAMEFYSVHDREEKETLYKFYILIWFVVGFVQFFFNREFLVSIVSGGRISLSDYRGCTSLASEPSFFGIQCYYFLYISKFFQKNRGVFYILNVIMGVVFAQSFVGILFVFSFFIQEYFDMKKGYKKVIYLFLGAAIILVLGSFMFCFFPDSRLVSLINGVVEDGINTLFGDESGQVRMSSIIDAFSSVKDHYFLPQGFGSQRIGSAWGGLCVEIGFFAIGYILLILKTFKKVYNSPLARGVTMLLVGLLYFSNVQLSNPMFAFVLGYMITFPKNRAIENTEDTTWNQS